MKQKTFLVRISNKVHIPVQYEHYEVVEALDEYEARHLAFDLLDERLKYEPNVRKKFFAAGLKRTEICAGDSVEI
jgi:hypothetical protein